MGAIGPRLALIVVGLAVVWTAAGWALLGRMAARHEARVAETVEATGGTLRGVQDVLLREARLLARDPAVIEGVVRGDWATLARGASPRMISLTVERIADLLLVLDAGGAPLVQVPATPRVAGLDVTPPPAPLSLVRPLGGPVYLLGVAPVRSAADVPVGVIVVGRRLERLAAGLDAVGGRPALVAVGGDRALGATRPDLPSAGWESATRAGVVQIGGEPWRLRPVGPGGGLWAAVSVAEDERARRRLWAVLLGSFALAAGAAGGIAWVIRRTAPVGATPAARVAEVLAALARLAGNEKDLARSLGEALDVVGAVAGASGGIMFRAAAATRTLVPVAHRGVPAERPELARAWPLDGSGLAEAVSDGQLVVVDLQS
ncbi:MAG: hypothetical protein HY728_08725, partial [Candidatus Rokubacteria bacterium]|nr:hypothetical protein [Candidatus Rokubacteria bacterium]